MRIYIGVFIALSGLAVALIYIYAAYLSIGLNSLFGWPTKSWPQAFGIMAPLGLALAFALGGIWLVFGAIQARRKGDDNR